jgi:hypothetical protein
MYSGTHLNVEEGGASSRYLGIKYLLEYYLLIVIRPLHCDQIIYNPPSTKFFLYKMFSFKSVNFLDLHDWPASLIYFSSFYWIVFHITQYYKLFLSVRNC